MVMNLPIFLSKIFVNDIYLSPQSVKRLCPKMSQDVKEISKPFSSAGNRNSKVVKTLGAELAGPKAMLVLGSHPIKDKEAVEKADKSLKNEMEKQRRKSAGVRLSMRSSPSSANSYQGSIASEDATGSQSAEERESTN
jgi:hypothetical protein